MEKAHAIYLLGMEVDWVEGLNNRGFTFNNPNATDTCVCGGNFVMLDAKDKVLEYAEVSPFSDEYQPIKDIPIASCATAWQSSEDGEV